MLRQPYTDVRAVVFDAVGTLIHAQPSVQAAYGIWGRRFGSRYTDEEILPRFHRAFARQEQWDAEHGLGRTSAAREEARWRAIVSEVLDDVTDMTAAYEGLWRHFGDAAHWRIDAAAAALWARLRDERWEIAVASNFDDRLVDVCRGLPELHRCRLFVSSQLGYRKPAGAFFAAIEQDLSLSGEEILLVGDDLDNDYRAARRRGWRALWIAGPQRRRRGGGDDGGEPFPSPAETVGSLADVAARLWERDA